MMKPDLDRVREDAVAASRVLKRAALRPRTYPGFVREIARVGMHLAMYPAGVASDALKLDETVRLGDGYNPQTPLRYLEPEAASTPIILVHGAMHNQSAFTAIKRALRRFGFRNVYTMNYNLIGRDVEQLAEQLSKHVQEIMHRTQALSVHLVCHSLGGVVARYYIQELGGDEFVHTCVTIGSPHKGTHAALVGRGAMRQLRPHSPLYDQLARSTREMPVKWVCFYSNLDSLVLPASNAKLEDPELHATNILVKDHGHLSLLSSRAVIRGIADALAHMSASKPVHGLEARRASS